MVCRLYNDSFIRAAGVFIILRPFLLLFRFALSPASPLHSYGNLLVPLIPLFHFGCLRDSITDVERFHNIMLSSYYGISIWIYKSLKHRLWKRPPERAQRASLTSSVHSYCSFASLFRLLRLSILTATLTPFIILFISHVREISLSVLWYYRYYRYYDIMILSVLWYYRYYRYYGLVFEYINLSNIDHQSERSERL
jgi:hypothetical protein